MQNNNPNDYLQEHEIHFKELIMLLINSKKLIITITLVITTLGAIYGFQKAPVYHSTALIDIGQYDTFENNNVLLESTSKLISNLNIAFIHKSDDYDSLTIKGIEQKLIKIEIHKPSIELAEKKIEEIIRYIENRHSLMLNNRFKKTKNLLMFKIESLNDRIEYGNKAILTQIEFEKKRIDNELPQIDNKINALNKVILEDLKNLKLLESNPDMLLKRAAQAPTLNQVIHSYNNQLLDLEGKKTKLLQDKDNLESQFKRWENNDEESNKIFKLSQEKDNLLDSQLEIFLLSQEKDNLQLELEFLMQQNSNSTQLVGEIVTNANDSKKELIILLSFIFGLFLSIVMVFINNSFKALKE
jgi:uncharacterized protein involved in exopolysaccharide biosynthesis